MASSSRLPWILALLLGVLDLGLALALPGPAAETTYVLLPMVDVVPGTVRLSADEGRALSGAVRTEAEARSMQQAVAMLGSTLSFDDLLRGIEQLDDLSPAQRQALVAELDAARAEREELLAVQRQLLEREGALERQVAALESALPGPGGGP